MKNKDLSNAIGNINLKYVEEAENFTAKRMSLTKIISLAACIAIIVTAIPAALILNREDGKTDAPIVTTPFNGENNDSDSPINTDAMKVIYCDADMLAVEDEIRKNVLNEKKIDFKEFVNYNDSLVEFERIQYSDDIPEKLNISLGTKELPCTLDYAYNTSAILSTNATLKSYAKIARYKIDLPEYSEGFILYRVNTQEIVKISTASGRDNGSLGGMTEEERRDLAERDIKALYGNDILSKYSYENSYKDRYGIRFVYARNFGEIKTDAKIILRYDSYGVLNFLDTNELGTFDCAQIILTDKKIIDSEAEAMQIIDGKLVYKKVLVMSNEGEPCIFYYCQNVVDGEMKYYKIGYKIK